jgi:hypothetical protein
MRWRRQRNQTTLSTRSMRPSCRWWRSLTLPVAGGPSVLTGQPGWWVDQGRCHRPGRWRSLLVRWVSVVLWRWVMAVSGCRKPSRTRRTVRVRQPAAVGQACPDLRRVGYQLSAAVRAAPELGPVPLWLAVGAQQPVGEVGVMSGIGFAGYRGSGVRVPPQPTRSGDPRPVRCTVLSLILVPLFMLPARFVGAGRTCPPAIGLGAAITAVVHKYQGKIK